MDRTIKFEVPGPPKPHPRPKAVRRGEHAGIYTPTSAQERKKLIQQYAMDRYSGPPHDGMVMMDLTFIMPRPKRLIWKTRPMPQVLCITGADLDNLAKGVMDALNGIIYRDDRQICQLVLRKFIAAGDDYPKTTITIYLRGADER